MDQKKDFSHDMVASFPSDTKWQTVVSYRLLPSEPVSYL